MPRLTIQQRTKIIELWHQTKSVKHVQRLYCRHFGIHLRHAPNFRTIKSTIAKFTNVETICDLHKGHSGRKRTGRSEENVEMVRQTVVQSKTILFDDFLPRRTFIRALFRGSFAKTFMPFQMRTQWFQQDGAPPHTARETRRFLKKTLSRPLYLSLRRR